MNEDEKRKEMIDGHQDRVFKCFWNQPLRDLWAQDQMKLRDAEVKKSCSLLQRSRVVKKKENVDWGYPKFKTLRFTLKTEDGKTIVDNETIDQTINICSLNGMDRLYDVVYRHYESGQITSDQWCAFENLSSRRMDRFHEEQKNTFFKKKGIVI